MDRKQYPISLLGITKEKSALLQLYKNKVQDDVAITSSEPYYYFLNGFQDADFSLKSERLRFFEALLSVSIQRESNLQKLEKPRFFFLCEEGAVNPDFSKTEDFDKEIERCYDEFVEKITKDVVKMMLMKNSDLTTSGRHLNFLEFSFFTKDYSETEMMLCLKAMRNLFIKNEETKKEFISLINEKLESVFNLKVLDIPSKNLYMVDFNVTIPEMLESGSLYKLVEFERTGFSIGANGEHITFSVTNEDKDDYKDIIISNGYYENGRHIFKNKKADIFMDKEVAIEQGRIGVEKIKELVNKKAIFQF